MEGQITYGKIIVYYIIPENVTDICYFHGTRETLKKLFDIPDGMQVGLLAIDGEDWNKDLSPWAAPAVFRQGGDFAGGAAGYLSFLCERVIPQIEENLNLTVKRRGLLGYSLAGLFAVYAMYETDIFTEIASVSGSLWYDGFIEYMKEREPKRMPEKVYFSLGLKEKKTKNPRMARIELCTIEAQRHLQSMGIDCVFESNPGNHFYQEIERMRKALKWIFRRG